MKRLFFLLMVAVAAMLLINVIYLSVNLQPDITLIKMFGYNFGINYSEHVVAKIAGVAAVMMVLMYIAIRDEHKFEEENKTE